MKYYIIGIKGSGTSTLANLLYDLGNSVCGYDDVKDYKFTMEGLNKRGINIYYNDNLPKLDLDTIVTYTKAISLDHPELVRVKNLGLKIISYNDLLGEITKNHESICVCGTHGKTTTSFMISSILDKSLGCSYFVGDGSGHGNKDSNLFVIESCEFNKHFLSYHPYNTVITNVELDHTETYPTIEDMIRAFQEFVNMTKNYCIVCGDDSNIKKISFNKVLRFGFNKDNDLYCTNKEVVNNKNCFDLYYKGELFDHYEINLFGDHLVMDVMASVLVGIIYDVDKNIIKDCINNYVPAKRRFNETIIGDRVIVDDYAHHPTEIKVTYDSCKQKYPNKEKVAVFLPNTYSRTKDFMEDFRDSLSLYDKAYVMDIYCDRERQEDYPGVSSDTLINMIPNAEKISLDTIDKLMKHDNSVVCFMSCTNISKMVDKYKELISK